jgi:hypothetical protein
MYVPLSTRCVNELYGSLGLNWFTYSPFSDTPIIASTYDLAAQAVKANASVVANVAI